MKFHLCGRQISLSVALVLLAFSSGGARGQEPRPDCWVLSAGVDNYPRVSKLKGCLADARNTSASFQAQQGKKFGKVHAQTLVDGQATRARILTEMNEFTGKGRPGDFIVLFLSGHGARANGDQTWYFLPHDFDPRNEADTSLTDWQILDACDVLVRRGRKVMVIVDACFAGQLGVTAQGYLSRYQQSKSGGLILMLSSGANQTSAALGAYSAFAKALADSMAGRADANRDGKVTLAEIQSYAPKRANDLIRQKGVPGRQDGEIAWSPSISKQMHLAMVKPSEDLADNRPPLKPGGLADNRPPIKLARPTNKKPPVKSAKTKFTEWTGSETLDGYGRLTFRLHDGGRAVMIDAAGASEGTWQQSGSKVTLRFFDGRVVYAGTKRGETLSGTGRNAKTSWTFSVFDSQLAGGR